MADVGVEISHHFYIIRTEQALKALLRNRERQNYFLMNGSLKNEGIKFIAQL
jgi:hypothetical protein